MTSKRLHAGVDEMMARLKAYDEYGARVDVKDHLLDPSKRMATHVYTGLVTGRKETVKFSSLSPKIESERSESFGAW